jgi:N-acetylgalactosamine kinase
MADLNTKVNKGLAEQTVVVILAAGKGTRMGRQDLAKVCFEIDGVPAISRLIETFRKNSFEKFLVVVGPMAQDVMEAVGKSYPKATFVYQSPQLGTGHAARVAAEALKQMGHSGPVLVTLGDKYIEPTAVQMLVEGFIRNQADLALLTTPETKATEAASGRVIFGRDSQAVGIVERIDFARQAIADELRQRLGSNKKITGSLIGRIVKRHIDQEDKSETAVGELMDLAVRAGYVKKAELEKVLRLEKYSLVVAGRRYTAGQIKKTCRQFNPSLYLFGAEAFYRGVSMIDNDNAQAEYYLTDVVKHLGNITDGSGNYRFCVRTVPVKNADLIQGFNSPDELLAIRDYVRRSRLKAAKRKRTSIKPGLKRNQYRTVTEWIQIIEAGGSKLQRWLDKIYSRHEELHTEKRKELLKVLKCYGRRFGFDKKVVVVRAPGRINLMGRHVDHRGGFNNFLALHRETIAVAGLRDDDTVIAVNTEPKKFRTQRFNITELIGQFAWSEWINFVNSDWVRNMLRTTAGEWGNYIKSAVLRLQHKYSDLKICGMNMAFYGDVPIAAGLSSSSTIVVATLQAAISLNNLELTSRQFVDLCCEGEWFVGPRGGAGDHAAIYLGQRGKIAQVGYLPFRTERVVDAPRDYQVIIADSHIKAAKSSSAKDRYNSKITAYNLGLELLKLRCPEIAGLLEYVRDLNPEKLACTTGDIYRALLKVPQYMTRREFERVLPAGQKEWMETNFSSHSDPDRYDVRGVLLFGAAECIRSRVCIDYLADGDIEAFGRLMKISHDGDRVSRPDSKGAYRPWQVDCSDEAMNRLITDLQSEDPQRVLGAQLSMQPGRYGCSTKEIDMMVDIACLVPGVAGAQIAGAGLGGCIMILARKDSVDAVRKALVRKYYRPWGLKPVIINCITVAGAGLIEI